MTWYGNVVTTGRPTRREQPSTDSESASELSRRRGESARCGSSSAASDELRRSGTLRGRRC